MKNRENFAELTELELDEKFHHFKEELFNLRFQVVTGQLTNVSRINHVKKNIARVQTFINKIVNERAHKQLKEEYESLLKEKSINPRETPLQERLSLLKTKLSGKLSHVKQEIKTQIDGKVAELIKTLRGKISEKLLGMKGRKSSKEEEELRASSRRLANPKLVIRKKFLDKLAGMGLNEASQIKTLKEGKRQKLDELERIQTLQRELNNGRLPF